MNTVLIYVEKEDNQTLLNDKLECQTYKIVLDMWVQRIGNTCKQVIKTTNKNGKTHGIHRT